MLGSQVYPDQYSSVVRGKEQEAILPIAEEWTQFLIWNEVCQARNLPRGIIIRTMRLTDRQTYRAADQSVGS